ncbi:tetratricopeptide repeat protein [Persephonella atlantica]|uniref:Tetratricopeptide repeat protein n=1 Tax=Persephonella atlantica TaxID=2699429 RepID=A0ABS1GJ75_9AQUI|nr:tetratricopeptide repeat protein [Persephonella atlantica]MBK3332979.1 tetratricopeptide repeat protein [Persephonella atlantica]
MKKYLLLIPAATLISACVKQEDIDLLQKELIEVKKELAQLKQNQTQMKEDIAQLSKRVDNVSKTASQNALELQKLKSFGKVEKETLPKEGEEQVKIPEKPDRLYKYALDAYFKGKMEEAREGFKKFIDRYKDSELYDNALFWLGQIYYAEGRYSVALKTFDRIINGCKAGEILDCNKLPAAMLKKAQCHLKLGEKSKALKILKTIIDNFPDTEEAEISRKKLEELR